MTKEERSAYQRAHYLKNKQKYLDKARAWRLENPGRFKENQDRYRRDNAAKLQEYRDSHKDQMSAANRSWYERNADHKRQYSREWAQRNKARRVVNQMRREARKNNAAGNATLSQVEARFSYYGNNCAYCPAPAETIDHVIPLSRGGSNWPANLRPACKWCNTSKGDRPLSIFLARRQENRIAA